MYSMPPSSAPALAPQPPKWNPFLILSVAIVSIIFMLLSSYSVLRRLCREFNAAIFPRNQLPSQILSDQSNFDHPSSQTQSNALESTVLNSLPKSQFKKGNKEPPWPSNTDCAVCLAEFEEGEWLKHLPSCTHAFHVSCIDTWFRSHSSCPLCRSSVFNLTERTECSV